jgi:hypothetical protein
MCDLVATHTKRNGKKQYLDFSFSRITSHQSLQLKPYKMGYQQKNTFFSATTKTSTCEKIKHLRNNDITEASGYNYIPYPLT